MSGERGVGGDEPCTHQRPHEREEARGIAAGIADAARGGDLVCAFGLELGEAIDPARGNAMGGRGIDDLGRAGAELIGDTFALRAY